MEEERGSERQPASLEAGIMTEDIAGDGKAYTTSEVGEWIARYIREKGKR